MKVFGISMVRNEADIIRPAVLHHLSLGLDQILILDNGSTDGTDEILQRLDEKHRRVTYIRDDSPFDQASITTELAREAHRHGADWVLPFDADEFWVAERGDFREILASSRAGALGVQPVNFVQDRRQLVSAPEALLTMTHRIAEPVEPGKHCRELVESQRIGFVEMAYPRKWISRPNEEVEVWRGNHRVVGIKGSREKRDDIVCLHAPLRSRAILESKVERRRRLDEAGIPRGSGAWHVHHWVRMIEEGMLEEEWAANSHEGGYLDVYGEKHRVALDHRLRDAVEPFVSGGTRRSSVIGRALTAGATRARSLLRR